MGLPLPAEILIKLFQCLPDRDLFSAELVCEFWSAVVVRYFWQPKLLKLTKKDYHLRRRLLEAGWKEQDPTGGPAAARLFRLMNDEKDRSWASPSRSVFSHCMISTNSEEASVKNTVMCVIPYRHKLFLSLNSGALEVWVFSTKDGDITVTLKKRLIEEMIAGSRGGHKMALSGSRLAASRRDSRFIYIWDADTETEIFLIKRPLLDVIIDLKMTSSVLVVLSGTSLVIYRMDDLDEPPQVLPAGGNDRPSDNRLDTKTLLMNDFYVVTLMPGSRGNCELVLSVRLTSDFTKRTMEQISKRVVCWKGATLSDKNLLALLETKTDMTAVLNVINVTTQSYVYRVSFPSSMSHLYIPECWFGSRLYIREVPTYGGDGVSLRWWESEVDPARGGRELKRLCDLGRSVIVRDLSMRTPNDILLISDFHVLQFTNDFDLRTRVMLSLYDYFPETSCQALAEN